MSHAQPRQDRESIDPQRLIDEELYDRDSRWSPRTRAQGEAPGGRMDSFWIYLALAMGIPPFPIFGADALAPQRERT